MKILVTGGAGFIGSNFVDYMISKYPDYKIIIFDALTYAGDLENLPTEFFSDTNKYEFIKGDIADQDSVDILIPKDVDAIINFAAESHVDNSIANPGIFLNTNILGTYNLLEFARKNNTPKFVQISTDEVYGSIDQGLFTEETQINPNSPYSATKASSDHLVRAYHETFKLNTNITRCSNNYGPRQHAEKLIPKTIQRALNNEAIPVYGNGSNVRDWLYVTDHCSAIDAVLHKGVPGEVYNIGGSNEVENIEVVNKILYLLDKSTNLIAYVEDRLGHDKRYAIDSTKIQMQLGWNPSVKAFEDGLHQTILWYVRRASE